MKETYLQSKICDYLAAKGYFFSRINNTPIYVPSQKCFRRMGKYAIKGFPDIVLIPHKLFITRLIDGKEVSFQRGQFVGLEIKSGRGVQSEDQKIVQRKIERAGGLYFLINSWESFINLGL
jgi:hypothetical protein